MGICAEGHGRGQGWGKGDGQGSESWGNKKGPLHLGKIRGEGPLTLNFLLPLPPSPVPADQKKTTVGISLELVLKKTGGMQPNIYEEECG